MNSNKIIEKVKSDYNLIAKTFSNTRFREWDEFSFFLKFYKPTSNVLDLGCGNGRLLDFLKKVGFEYYLGVDQSEKLLKIARSKYPRYTFLEQEFSNLNLDNRFDSVFIIASLHHLPPDEQLHALKGLKKYLNQGAYLFITNWNLHQFRYLPFLLKSIFLPSYGFRGVLIPWQNKIKRYYYSFTKRRLEKILIKSGYKIIFNDYYNGNIFSARNILTIAKFKK